MTNDIQLDLQINESYLKKLQELKDLFNIQYFNVRFNSSISTVLHINSGNMKTSHMQHSYGFSIIAFTNGGYGFSLSNTIDLKQLEKKFEEASKIAKWAATRAAKNFSIDEMNPINVKYIQEQKKKIFDISQEEKLEFLLEQDNNARKFDKRIINTESIYSDSQNHEIIYTSDERLVDLTNSIARIYLICNSKENNVMQEARENIGITGGFEITDKAMDIGEKSAKKAIKLLEAKQIKGGKYDIIADPFLSGTMIHEAFGHSCEADEIIGHNSQLEGRIGERVGKSFINVFEDPSLDSFYGSIKYDSEGIEAKKLQLIKNGILNEFMHSRETASIMNVKPTGNGRANSYQSIPSVRMRNTYLGAGDWDLDEMLEEIDDGLLCNNWVYGYTKPSTGEFQFKMESAWKIENGKKTQLIRDAALSGEMLTVLKKISNISKVMDFDSGVCGKGGQHVPVCSGGPYVTIKEVIIGGD